MGKNQKHSSLSNEHYTPPPIISVVRRLMGNIDLDPASNAVANKIVNASRIYTKSDNGLAKSWHGNVFLNPPGGLVNSNEYGDRARDSSQKVWFRKALLEWQSGHCHRVFYLGFQLAILRMGGREIDRYNLPFVIPYRRINFYQYDVEKNQLKPQKSPTHENVLIYFPNLKDRELERKKFIEMFTHFGFGR
jgi:ParB family chromosome partitioning protein